MYGKIVQLPYGLTNAQLYLAFVLAFGFRLSACILYLRAACSVQRAAVFVFGFWL